MDGMNKPARPGGPLAFVLAALVFAGVGVALWLDQDAAAPERKVAPGPVGDAPPLRTAPDTVPLPRGPLPSFYKCSRDGRVVYQDSPCPHTALPVEGGTFSIVDATPILRADRAGDAGGPHAASIAPPQRLAEGVACHALREAVRQVDAQARRHSGDILTQRRQALRARMTELNCGEFD